MGCVQEAAQAAWMEGDIGVDGPAAGEPVIEIGFQMGAELMGN